MSRRFPHWTAPRVRPGVTTRLLAGLGLAGCLALASGCDILRISVAADGTSSDGLSAHPSLSADGRFVAFESSATNLAPGCSGSGFFNGESDGHIYLYDRNPNTTSCLTGPVAPVAEADFREPKLSANGAIVAFTAVTFNRLEVFVLDRPARQLTRVSVATDGTPADGRALDAALSADGRVVAFASDATNLDPRCVPLLFRTQIFVHERITGTTTCVSVAPDGTRGNNDSRQPALSADGRFVAFGSQATNLDPRCPGLSARCSRNTYTSTTAAPRPRPRRASACGPTALRATARATLRR